MTRVFTVEEANRTLPLVSRIVEDIVRDYARWREKVDAFEVEVARSEGASAGADALRFEKEAQSLAEEIERCVGELAELGIEFKGFDAGLVDFPGELDGRPVYLCWRLGEAQVEYWHDLESGFAGRQPLHAGVGSGGGDQGDGAGSR